MTLNRNHTDPSSWSFIVPLETKLNLALKEGRKFEQLQTYDGANVPDGIGYDSSTSWINIEEHILNFAYSS